MTSEGDGQVSLKQDNVTKFFITSIPSCGGTRTNISFILNKELFNKNSKPMKHVVPQLVEYDDDYNC